MTKKQYDLEERTARFGEQIIEFTHDLPDTPVVKPLKSQVVRSGTSIGANYTPFIRDCVANRLIQPCHTSEKSGYYTLVIIAKQSEMSLHGS